MPRGQGQQLEHTGAIFSRDPIVKSRESKEIKPLAEFKRLLPPPIPQGLFTKDDFNERFTKDGLRIMRVGVIYGTHQYKKEDRETIINLWSNGKQSFLLIRNNNQDLGRQDFYAGLLTSAISEALSEHRANPKRGFKRLRAPSKTHYIRTDSGEGFDLEVWADCNKIFIKMATCVTFTRRWPQTHLGPAFDYVEEVQPILEIEGKEIDKFKIIDATWETP